MSRATQGERIAVLETEMDAVTQTLAQQGETLSQIATQQQEILRALSKNKGFWGGIILTMSAVGTAITMAKDGVADFIARLFH